jgi:hypothetical protein
MAYFVEIKNGLVINSIVIEDAVIGVEFPESENVGKTFIESLNVDGFWLQTSDAIRNQHAGIGFAYDADADVFIAPQPFPSWTLDENYDWQAPTPKPEGSFYWDEETLAWVATPAI